MNAITRPTNVLHVRPSNSSPWRQCTTCAHFRFEANEVFRCSINMSAALEDPFSTLCDEFLIKHPQMEVVIEPKRVAHLSQRHNLSEAVVAAAAQLTSIYLEPRWQKLGDQVFILGWMRLSRIIALKILDESSSETFKRAERLLGAAKACCGSTQMRILSAASSVFNDDSPGEFFSSLSTKQRERYVHIARRCLSAASCFGFRLGGADDYS